MFPIYSAEKSNYFSQENLYKMELITELTRVIKLIGNADEPKNKVVAVVRTLLPDVAEDIISHTYDVVVYLAHNKKVLKGIKQTCRCI